jgi:predicted Fe-Mo cluster-binding NifX family protein
MKIALVTNDGRTISAHFGRARAYVVVTVEDGQVVAREQRERPDPDNQEQTGEAATTAGGGHHGQAIAPIQDCDVVLSRGMGAGMHLALQRAHVRPIMTDIVNIDEALKTFMEGRMVNKPDLVH